MAGLVDAILPTACPEPFQPVARGRFAEETARLLDIVIPPFSPPPRA